MGFVDGELLRGDLSQPGQNLEAEARALLAELDGATELRLRGRAGTDLTLRVEGRRVPERRGASRAGGIRELPGR